MGQILDDVAQDVEVGAFCIAMRIKGETADELAGFLDAVERRIHPIGAPPDTPVIVLPSYNGARKFPLLTPLLGLLLAQRGLPVVMHGMPTEDGRATTSGEVLQELGILESVAGVPIGPGELRWLPTRKLSAGLVRLLDLRRTLTLRNSGHSLVKMVSPIHGKSLVLSSYTHGDYGHVMQETFMLRSQSVLLFHGLEGEVMTEPRRLSETVFLKEGKPEALSAGPRGWGDTDLGATRGRGLSLDQRDVGVTATAEFTRAVLTGQVPVPDAITDQVALITTAWHALR